MQERNNRRNKKKEKLKKKSGTITGRHLVAVWASFFLSVSVIPSSISCQSSEHSSHLVAALTCRASFHLFRDGEREFHQSGQRRNGIGFVFFFNRGRLDATFIQTEKEETVSCRRAASNARRPKFGRKVGQ